jgi:predicted nucleotidyltransferase
VSNADRSLPPSGQTLEQTLKALVAIFDARLVDYAIIGGIAAIQHGRVRTTNDIDTLVSVNQIAMPGMFEALEAGGFKAESLRNSRELRDEGLTTIRLGDVVVDLMRPILPVYVRILKAAVKFEILGQTVRVCSVEGLILMKLIAFRPQDEADIKDLMAAHADRLDLKQIREEFATVAGRDDPRWAKLESWVRELSSSGN